MEDVYRFCLVMAIVTGALAAFDRKGHFATGQEIMGLDLAHIGFGAAAGVVGVVYLKSYEI